MESRWHHLCSLSGSQISIVSRRRKASLQGYLSPTCSQQPTVEGAEIVNGLIWLLRLTKVGTWSDVYFCPSGIFNSLLGAGPCAFFRWRMDFSDVSFSLSKQWGTWQHTHVGSGSLANHVSKESVTCFRGTAGSPGEVEQAFKAPLAVESSRRRRGHWKLIHPLRRVS